MKLILENELVPYGTYKYDSPQIDQSETVSGILKNAGKKSKLTVKSFLDKAINFIKNLIQKIKNFFLDMKLKNFMKNNKDPELISRLKFFRKNLDECQKLIKLCTEAKHIMVQNDGHIPVGKIWTYNLRTNSDEMHEIESIEDINKVLKVLSTNVRESFGYMNEIMKKKSLEFNKYEIQSFDSTSSKVKNVIEKAIFQLNTLAVKFSVKVNEHRLDKLKDKVSKPEKELIQNMGKFAIFLDTTIKELVDQKRVIANGGLPKHKHIYFEPHPSVAGAIPRIDINTEDMLGIVRSISVLTELTSKYIRIMTNLTTMVSNGQSIFK